MTETPATIPALPWAARRVVDGAAAAGNHVTIEHGEGWAQVYVQIPGHMTWTRWIVFTDRPQDGMVFDVAYAPYANGQDGYVSTLGRYRTLIGLGK